jgi:hypothetical protein
MVPRVSVYADQAATHLGAEVIAGVTADFQASTTHVRPGVTADQTFDDDVARHHVMADRANGREISLHAPMHVERIAADVEEFSEFNSAVAATDLNGPNVVERSIAQRVGRQAGKVNREAVSRTVGDAQRHER